MQSLLKLPSPVMILDRVTWIWCHHSFGMVLATGVWSTSCWDLRFCGRWCSLPPSCPGDKWQRWCRWIPGTDPPPFPYRWWRSLRNLWWCNRWSLLRQWWLQHSCWWLNRLVSFVTSTVLELKLIVYLYIYVKKINATYLYPSHISPVHHNYFICLRGLFYLFYGRSVA